MSSKMTENEQFNRLVLKGLVISMRKGGLRYLGDIVIRQWSPELITALNSYELEDGGRSFRIRKPVFDRDKRRANSAMRSLQVCFRKLGRTAVFKSGRYSGELHVGPKGSLRKK